MFSDNGQIKQFVWWRKFQDGSVILPTASNQHWGKEGRERTGQETARKENGLSEVYRRARHGGACLSPSAWEQREQ